MTILPPFSFSGMWKADKDKCMISVMTGNSGSMHSFRSHVGIGSNEHVFEADSWINFLTSCSVTGELSESMLSANHHTYKYKQIQI